MIRTLTSLTAALLLAGCTAAAPTTATTTTSAHATPAPTTTRKPSAHSTSVDFRQASTWPIPKDNLTPGALDPGCKPGRPQSQRNVTTAEKNQIAAAYHYTGPRGLPFLEFDHRIPFALCGASTPANIWPETVDDAPLSQFVHNRKDQLEAKIFTLIRGHRITFTAAQALFAKPNDWRHAWCQYVHTPTDGVTCDE